MKEILNSLQEQEQKLFALKSKLDSQIFILDDINISHTSPEVKEIQVTIDSIKDVIKGYEDLINKI